MKQDWRLQILGLNGQGELTQEAVRAAYWREITRERGRFPELQQAKRELLFELGLRVPGRAPYASRTRNQAT